MRIALIGQAPFGARVLQSLLERGEQVAAVYVPPEAAGGRLDPLHELAGERNIPVFQPSRMRDTGVYETYANLAPDLGVMAFVTDIVPESVLNCPRLGTIQYHPSLLPRHRGGSAINWAVIQGETRTGLTIFWPDGGIDTGPILLQKEADISPDDTVGSLYFDKLFPLGVEAIMEAIDLVRDGKAPKIPQDESKATYEGLCGKEQAIIDWSEEASRVYNLIRGTNPQPGATTSFRGRKLQVFDSALLAGDDAHTPGEIVESDETGITVGVQGGRLLIKRVRPEGMPKTGASDYAASLDLRAGERLGS